VGAMGIDTFASRSPEDIELTEEDINAFRVENIQLCGGVFSGDGSDGSFRGKVYSLLIIEITGQSLTQEWIPPEVVSEMYNALLGCDPDQVIEEFRESNDSSLEIIELRKFFKVCNDRGLGLINWG